MMREHEEFKVETDKAGELLSLVPTFLWVRLQILPQRSLFPSLERSPKPRK